MQLGKESKAGSLLLSFVVTAQGWGSCPPLSGRIFGDCWVGWHLGWMKSFV